MSPKAFLHKLGIKPLRKTSSVRYRQDTNQSSNREAGQDVDLMGIDQMNPLFTDERTAVATLSGNFDRLAKSMERVGCGPVFKGDTIRRVCELGGGTGVISMWLTTTGKCQASEVVDHAENPLAVGRLWAERSLIANVTFKHTNYAAIAASASRDFDFVFAEHAIDLGYMEENPDLSDSIRTDTYSRFLTRYRELAAAFSKLLRSEGIGSIGAGSFTPDSLLLLCQALRENGMAISWEFTSNQSGLQLYFQPQGHILLDSTEDEALAILSDSVPPRKVPPAEARSLEAIFRQGKTFAEICSEGESVKYKCTLVQRAGLACVFQKSSNGHEIATLFSASKMHTWTRDILRDAAKRSITKRFIDQRLIPLLKDD